MSAADAMSVVEALRTRRSIRHFTDAEVPREVIASLVEQASWAPSGGNDQPWAVTAVSPPAFRALSEALEGKLWAALVPKLASVIPEAQAARSARAVAPEVLDKIAREARTRGAPWGLFVHAASSDIPGDVIASFHAALTDILAPSERPSLEEMRFMNGPVNAGVTTASVVCFGHALMLAAAARGLATCMQHSWLCYEDVVRERIGVPVGRTLRTVVLIGEADTSSQVTQEAAERARRRAVPIDYV